ncbi:DUF3006 domain-containing protein [Anaerobacillus sp. MEB173]|uniref:DUF3006 domain-containing protein n=1 Tax=Anaerobacillus sp. MEB173 TaxID=3383345 RepID=UPI003F91371F
MKAVFERIVDGKIAVILVGEDEREYTYPIQSLPEGIRAGDHLEVVIDADTITDVKASASETTAAKERMSDKMKQLQARKESRFKKK